MRFPEFGETTKTQSTIPVVLDLFVYRDIVGLSNGVNSELTAAKVEEAKSAIEKGLLERGFSIEIIASLNGLTYSRKEKAKYVISKDWKSTGKDHLPIVLDQEGEPWHSTEAKNYISGLFETAREMNFSVKKDQTFAEQKIASDALKDEKPLPVVISESALEPSLLEGLGSNVVLFVKVEGRFQKLAKFITRGIIVGAASSALTGGLAVVPPGSYAIAEIVAFDVASKKILWHNRAVTDGNSSVKTALKRALSQYPFSDGESLWHR